MTASEILQACVASQMIGKLHVTHHLCLDAQEEAVVQGSIERC
jgi:hypothetical protein